METKDLLERYENAVKNMNNFASGIHNIDERIEFGEMEICSVDLDNDDTVYVTPSTSIWERAYAGHNFAVRVYDLSQHIILDLCELLESEFSRIAAEMEDEN